MIGEEAFRSSEAIGDVWFMASGINFVLARALVGLQEYDEAEKQLERSLRWHKELETGDTAWRVAATCSNLGKVALLTQDYANAMLEFAKAVAFRFCM